MPKFGFLIDNRKCIGCHACTVACKSEHQVPVGVDRTWVKYIEKGTFPNNRRLFTVMRCNHCEWAPCVTICPVTALYIDPDTHTAAKCNFCTHRLEVGLQPSCVVVCPEQAIISGDLDDPGSEISRLLSRHPVQVRKPEKETRPKLFYIEADEASLVPTRAAADGPTMWSRGSYVATDGQPVPTRDSAPSPNGENGRVGLPVVAPGAPRRAYDVRPRAPAWGWEVAAYTWTKSLAAGALLAVAAAWLLAGTARAAALAVPMGVVALVFLA